MPQGAAYPISLLLERLIWDHGPTLAEFVARLGYRNIERGLRRLEPWLTQGEGYPRIIQQVKSAFPSVAVELRLSVEATVEIRRVEARRSWHESCEAEAATFNPFIYCQGERTVPSGLCVFGFTGGHQRWTTIEIPNPILDLPLGEQLSALPALMRSYIWEYEGHVPFFGMLRYFKFVRAIDHYVYDRSATLIGMVPEPFPPGELICSSDECR